jgi:hypothetical protein
MGFMGSWFFSCVTSSFRNRSPDSSLLVAIELASPLELAGVAGGEETAGTVLMGVLGQVQGLGQKVNRRWLGSDRHCPICKVLSNRLLAVFMTSTLFWYEREAEIMFTISSTALTLLKVT